MLTRAEELAIMWEAFANEVKSVPDINLANLPDIRKLMTSEFVIDFSLHEIYTHAKPVNELTRRLIHLKRDFPENNNIADCHQRWLAMLRLRNQFPLKLLHHQRLDGECDFRFSLQLMEGRPCGFKEVQVVDRQNGAGSPKLIQSVHRLDCIAGGISFAGLPLVKDKVLASLMEFEDIIFLAAKDQSDQFIGHLWGVLLRDVEIGKDTKANIFWWMELARDPDFFDDHTNIGAQLRTKMFSLLQARQDWNFIGYQHVLHHKFHMGIVGNAHLEDEFVYCNNERFDAKSVVKYHDDLSSFMRAQFIRSNNNKFAYPEYESIQPAILKAFWRASRSVTDFVFGGISFFRRQHKQQTSHNLLASPLEQRLLEKLTTEKQACDKQIMIRIILSDHWPQQSRGLFGAKRVSDMIEKLQSLTRANEFDFTAIKACVTSKDKSATKCHLTDILCHAISAADSPTFVINTLLSVNDIPAEWLELINHYRGLILKGVILTDEISNQSAYKN